MNREVKEAVKRTSLTYQTLIDSHMTAKDKETKSELEWISATKRISVPCEVRGVLLCLVQWSSILRQWRVETWECESSPEWCSTWMSPLLYSLHTFGQAPFVVRVGVVYNFFFLVRLFVHSIQHLEFFVREVLFHGIKTCGVSVVSYLFICRSRGRKWCGFIFWALHPGGIKHMTHFCRRTKPCSDNWT